MRKEEDPVLIPFTSLGTKKICFKKRNNSDEKNQSKEKADCQSKKKIHASLWTNGSYKPTSPHVAIGAVFPTHFSQKLLFEIIKIRGFRHSPALRTVASWEEPEQLTGITQLKNKKL